MKNSTVIDEVTVVRNSTGGVTLHIPENFTRTKLANWRKKNQKALKAFKREASNKK